ncbi:ATP-binding protein [Streptomyces sp. NBC_01803]|uniref:ATP-binding protein n=1 Tax=Streptomyces sp. NBC_01803 TaxID=2975946 RepID=UPI002DDAB537|nr:ATP-binding protein [Streptomyces sp. NBC_01803]WSA47517.1 ATP-binding protein [Streptomyces sp. NBC_01803]
MRFGTCTSSTITPETTSAGGRRCFAVALPADGRVTADLRRAVREHARRWGVPDCADAVLVASELFANAVLHGTPAVGTSVRVEVAHLGECIRIAVTDGCRDRVPVRRDVSETAESGRGLRLLDDLTRDWDTTVAEDGKTVWAEVPIHPAT